MSTIKGAGVDSTYFFEHNVRDDPKKQTMSRADFTRLIKGYYQSTTAPEILSLFNFFDKGKGYISKQDFLNGVSSGAV